MRINILIYYYFLIFFHILSHHIQYHSIVLIPHQYSLLYLLDRCHPTRYSDTGECTDDTSSLGSTGHILIAHCISLGLVAVFCISLASCVVSSCKCRGVERWWEREGATWAHLDTSEYKSIIVVVWAVPATLSLISPVTISHCTLLHSSSLLPLVYDSGRERWWERGQPWIADCVAIEDDDNKLNQ